MRKGQTYGTLLLDLEQHRPIELLPDRSAATLSQWLQAHPGIEVIVCDQSSEYAHGATEGAPTGAFGARSLQWHPEGTRVDCTGGCCLADDAA